MTNLTSLPTENVLQIFSLLPNSDLISVGETCEHLLHLSRTALATRILAALQDPRHRLSSSDLDMAADLVTYLPEEGMKILAARVQATWSSGGYQYYPSVGKVRCAVALAVTGQFPQEVLTTLATKMRSTWSADADYWPRAAEVRVCSPW